MKYHTKDHRSSNSSLYGSEQGCSILRSCRSCLSEFPNEFGFPHNNGNSAICICLDMTKDFGDLSHTCHIYKLLRTVIVYRFFSWFVCYVTGRYERAGCGDPLATPQPMTGDVVRGSVPVHLLPLMYTSDTLTPLWHCTSVLFADHTKTLYTFDPPDPSVLVSHIKDNLNSPNRQSLSWQTQFYAT